MLQLSSRQDQSIPRALMPLYTRAMKETVRLTECLNIVSQATGEIRKESDTAHFTALYLRKMIAELESPLEFIKPRASTGYRFMHRIPRTRSRRVRRDVQYVARRLQMLLDRVRTAELQATGSRQSDTALYRALVYYRLGLQVLTHTIEKESASSGRSPRRRLVLSLKNLRVRMQQLVSLPAEAITQFDETGYLQDNPDVRMAVTEGNLVSGLEHFASQGVLEAMRGGRSSGGVSKSLLAQIAIELSVDVPGIETVSPLELQGVIAASGLFAVEWYQERYGEGKEALRSYCQSGAAQGNDPNPVFNTRWYLSLYAGKSCVPGQELYHYIVEGEQSGHRPCEWFDPSWYRAAYQVAGSELALAHYLRDGRERGFSPNAIFDVGYYLERYEDVAESGIDPVKHYFDIGWREGRQPSASFVPSSYLKEHKLDGAEVNPTIHALEQGGWSEPAATSQLKSLPQAMTDSDLPALNDMAGNIHYFANPGPLFETPSALDPVSLKARVRAIAFYLPQFHAFKQNDAWWGKGFTEWRNVARGTPRYAGHYQPRIPRDLGYYDLNDERVLLEQTQLARRNGIEAFCFYYYWFNGQKLMDMPLERFLKADIEHDFCIMWANENWTRTWDGFDSEVLIKQDYRHEDEEVFLADSARYMCHERYVRVDGRPLFILYRPGLLPSSKKTLARWRRSWTERLGVTPVILMVQGFGDEDPKKFGLDGAVEFPPHKLCADIPQIQDRLHVLDPQFSGQIKRYEDVIDASLSEKTPSFPLVKTVVPHWDNDARREGRGFTMHGSTPALYERWLKGVADHACKNPLLGEPLVFINAWNEWAEGAYLEPDVHFGHAYLNATQRAVHGLPDSRERTRVLLVGHDAYRHGAQLLLLSMASTMKQQFGVDVTILLKSAGPLMEEYAAIGRTVVLDQLGTDNLPGWLRHEGFDTAICNTSVTGDLVPVLRGAGCRTVSLIHEMPALIQEYELESNLADIAASADNVVFPSLLVEQGFRQFAPDIAHEVVVRPQGIYKNIEFDRQGRADVRRLLGIGAEDKVVLNVGFADLRKGFDIFIDAARLMCAERDDVHFIWVGALSNDMRRWVSADLEGSALAKRVHLVDFTDRMADFYSASDCLFLTSREDPYPSVVLEAMCIGLPTVLFEGATGFDALAAELGYLCDRQRPGMTQRALLQALFNDSKQLRRKRCKHVEANCQFDDYCFELLQKLKPGLRKVSVVVPNYNYAQHLPQRMQSVFDQSYPVFETIVLDDCSTDDSLQVIEQVASGADRKIKLVRNLTNSGNVFRQWTRGAQMARGDRLWIAEADDAADSQFLAESVRALQGGGAFSFTDSTQIGTDNERVAESYDYYYRQVDVELFKADFVMAGLEFIQRAMSVRNVVMNVSSILWNSEAMRVALAAEGDTLYRHKLVGDWRLYLRALSDADAQVAYIAAPLNTHRRHKSSVTHALDHQLHLDEIQGVHATVLRLLGEAPELGKAQQQYIDELHEQFGLAPRTNIAARLTKAA